MTRLQFTAAQSLFALVLGAAQARADMYTWVDASGRVNVSNLAPPEGARVANVKHDVAPKLPPPDPAWETARAAAREQELQALAARAHELEVQALAERVRSLEREVEWNQQRRYAPQAAFDYPAPPPAIQYVADAPQTSGGCNPAWPGCWWSPGMYSGGVIVVGVPQHRRFNSVNGGFSSVNGGQRLGQVRPLPVRGGGAPARRH